MLIFSLVVVFFSLLVYLSRESIKTDDELRKGTRALYEKQYHLLNTQNNIDPETDLLFQDLNED